MFRILVLCLISIVSVGSSFGNETSEHIQKLENLLALSKIEISNGEIGIEQVEDNSSIISQENIVFELERNLEEDPGFCSYETQKDSTKILKTMDAFHAQELATFLTDMKEKGLIAHISYRGFMDGNVKDCSYFYYRVILSDGSLIWIDFDYTE